MIAGMSGKVIPVRVALRARPLIPREENEGCQTCLWFNSDETQVVLGKDKAFTFDYVFSPKHNQQDVYEKAAQSLVESTFKGEMSLVSCLFVVFFIFSFDSVNVLFN